METVIIISENAGFTEPLTIKLAPERLTPAGVGNGVMQSVRINIVPIFSSDVVTQGIFIGMSSDSRISAGAGGKEHKHGVIAAGSVGSALVDVAEIRQILIKIMPAFAGTVGYNFDHIWIIFGG